MTYRIEERHYYSTYYFANVVSNGESASLVGFTRRVTEVLTRDVVAITVKARLPAFGEVETRFGARFHFLTGP
jgi:hypothetical protein